MPRSYSLYVGDILTAIERIERFAHDLDEHAFVLGEARVDGILFNLMTIGEAAKNIPPDVQALAPSIQWSQLARFRDFVAHHYFGLDMRRVWQIVQSDLPRLKPQIQQLWALLKETDDGEE